jgi:glycosidase
MSGVTASSIRTNIEDQRALFPKGALHMRISDDHDELRATTRYSYPGAIAASTLMFTLDGTPLIYNGMEVGDSTQSAAPALFEPQKIFWQASDWHPAYPKFYAAIAALREQHPALQQGEIVWLHNSDEQHIVTYLRRSGTEEFLVTVNLSNTPFRGTVEVAGNWKEVQLPGLTGAQASLPALSLDAFGARIFQK